MIRHEGNDPRRPQRDAAEKDRRDRTMRRLVIAIAALSTAVAFMLLRSGSFLG